MTPPGRVNRVSQGELSNQGKETGKEKAATGAARGEMLFTDIHNRLKIRTFQEFLYGISYPTKADRRAMFSAPQRDPTIW